MIGAYQLAEALKAADRLAQRGVATAVTHIIEAGRFRLPRDERDAAHGSPADLVSLFPQTHDARAILTHTRPEPMVGLLHRLDTGARKTRVFGFLSRGGTLDVGGMLFANRTTWAHAVTAAAGAAGLKLEQLLGPAELRAVRGQDAPRAIMSQY